MQTLRKYVKTWQAYAILLPKIGYSCEKKPNKFWLHKAF
jgi:hypothetical protein